METIDGLVSMVLEQRKAAKAAKDWATSDKIRDDLKALGIQIKDTKDGDKIRDDLKALGIQIKDTKDGTTWNLDI